MRKNEREKKKKMAPGYWHLKSKIGSLIGEKSLQGAARIGVAQQVRTEKRDARRYGIR